MDAMDADDANGVKKFDNPISDVSDKEKSARDFDGAAEGIDPAVRDSSSSKGMVRVATNEPTMAIQRDMVDEIVETKEKVDMDPLSITKKCWGQWQDMTCEERMGVIKTVSLSSFVSRIFCLAWP